MTRIQVSMSLLFVGLLLLLWCLVHTEQAKAAKPAAAPWSIEVPDDVARSLSVKHINLPDSIIGAESLAFDRQRQGTYIDVSNGHILNRPGSRAIQHRRPSRARGRKRPKRADMCGNLAGLLFQFCGW
ncbi:unnamed protein product [Urochloa humidicola]